MVSSSKSLLSVSNINSDKIWLTTQVWAWTTKLSTKCCHSVIARNKKEILEDTATVSRVVSELSFYLERFSDEDSKAQCEWAAMQLCSPKTAQQRVSACCHEHFLKRQMRQKCSCQWCRGLNARASSCSLVTRKSPNSCKTAWKSFTVRVSRLVWT